MTNHDPTGTELAEEIAQRVAMSTSFGAVRSPIYQPKPRKRSGLKEEQRSGPGPDDRDPQLLGSVFDAVVKAHHWDTRMSLSLVLKQWVVLVGQQNADHAKPVDFRDGVLYVQCDSTAWAVGMRYMASQLVAKLNAELGDSSVRRVEILAPSQENWKKGPRSVRDGRGPRDTYG